MGCESGMKEGLVKIVEEGEAKAKAKARKDQTNSLDESGQKIGVAVTELIENMAGQVREVLEKSN